MRNRTSAGVMIAISLYVLLHIIYMLLGTVDLVYIKGDEVLCRQDGVCALSIIRDPMESMDDETYAENAHITSWTLEDGSTYVHGEDTFGLRCNIALNVITDLFRFRWTERSEEYYIIAQE